MRWGLTAAGALGAALIAGGAHAQSPTRTTGTGSGTLAATTGPPAGAGPGGYTGNGLGSSSYALSTSSVTPAGSATTATTPSGIQTSTSTGTPAAATSLAPSTPAGPPPAVVTSTTPEATGTASTMRSEAGASAPSQGASAFGETVSAGGTAVVPSPLSTPTATPIVTTAGIGAAGTAPAATTPLYPSLPSLLLD